MVLGTLNFIFLADKNETDSCRNDHDQESSQQAVEEVHQRRSHRCLTLVFNLKVWQLCYKQFYRSVNRLRSVLWERIFCVAAKSKGDRPKILFTTVGHRAQAQRKMRVEMVSECNNFV